MAETKPTAVLTSSAPGRAAPAVAFTVEFGDDHNRNFLWPPDQRLLRGRWDRANYAGVVTTEQFAHFPDLPGHRLTLDSVRRTYSILDPLAEPRYRQVLDKARQICLAIWGERCRPDDETVLEKLDDDALKTACYWVRRLLDARQCRVLAGKVPEMDAVQALPGLISFENFDQGSGPEARKKLAGRRYSAPKFVEEVAARVADDDLLEGVD